MDIIQDFSDPGFSSRNDRRPAFQRMIRPATSLDHPIDVVLMFMFNRIARNVRLFLNTLGDLEDVGIEVISITEDFGTGRSRRIGRTISAMIAEEQALDASVLTRKSRQENARQGFYNGGPIAFGYQTYVPRQDGEKSRTKLKIVNEETVIVRRIFDWADVGRGGRWIVKELNKSANTLRGARFTNGDVAGTLSREVYTGVYYDRTADSEGVVPNIEDAIAIGCPDIVSREQFDRVAALRATRNPRRTAPHFAAGTTLLFDKHLEVGRA